MSSVGILIFDGYPVDETHDSLDQWLFRRTDQRIFQRKISERNNLAWVIDPAEEKIETAYIFETSVGTMIKRLEARGFTLDAARSDFAESVELEKERIENDAAHIMQLSGAEYLQLQRKSLSMPFEKWQSSINYIIQNKIAEIADYGYGVTPFTRLTGDEQIDFMLNANRDRRAYSRQACFRPRFGYVCTAFEHFSRAVLELLDRDAKVALDATELVRGGWTDSFELLDDIRLINTGYYKTLLHSLEDLNALCETEIDSNKRRLLVKLLFANAITIMETYLSDALIATIRRFPALIRKVVETETQFSEKIPLSELFRRYSTINKEVERYLQRTLYHKLHEVRRLYKTVLSVDFPQDISRLMRAVDIRHGIVHRNGKAIDGRFYELQLSDIAELTNNVKELATMVDAQIMDIYVEMFETDQDIDGEPGIPGAPAAE